MANRKIDFIIIGAQRAGTSALNFYLKKHPDIGMGARKELHFFDNEHIFGNQPVDYSLYEKQFDFAANKKVYGEATPIYFYWKPSMKRLWDYNQNLKLILLLRNPIERAFSQWCHEVSRDTEHLEFISAIKNESYRGKEALPLQHRVYSYVDRGFYTPQLKRVFRLFKRSQLLIIKYEDFRARQEEILIKVFNFLNVNPDGYKFRKIRAVSRQPMRNMTSQERQYLLGLYQVEIEEIEKTLNWDCSDWKE